MMGHGKPAVSHLLIPCCPCSYFQLSSGNESWLAKGSLLDHSFLKIFVSGDHLQKVPRLDTVSDHGFNHFSVAWFSGRGSSHHKNGMQLRNLCIKSARRDTLSNLAWVFQWDIESVKLLIAGPHVLSFPCTISVQPVLKGSTLAPDRFVASISSYHPPSLSRPDFFFSGTSLSTLYRCIIYTFYAHNIYIYEYIHMFREKANTCMYMYICIPHTSTSTTLKFHGVGW